MPHAFAARSVPTISLALFLGAVAAGCRTTIPVTDTTPPRVELRISGPGVGDQRMSNPPFSLWVGENWTPYLELVEGAEYRFTLIVSDDGGVARAFLEMPLHIEVSKVSPSSAVTVTDAFMREMTVWGSRAEPRSELHITGRMRPRETTTVGFAFHTEGDNFGGRSGHLLRTFLSVEAFVVPAYGVSHPPPPIAGNNNTASVTFLHLSPRKVEESGGK